MSIQRLWPAAAFLAGIACSSSTEPKGGPQFTHPVGEVFATMSLPARPYAAAVSTSGVVYVGTLDDQRLTRVTASTGALGAVVTVGLIPTDITFSDDGLLAVVANQYSQNIGVVTVSTNTQTATIPVPGNPFAVIPSHDASVVFVATTTDRVYKVTVATGAIQASVPVEGTVQNFALTADGTRLYASTRSGGTVAEINTATMTRTRTFIGRGLTQQVVLSPDETQLYVVSEVGTLFTYNRATGALIREVELGGQAWGMAMTRDGEQLWIGLLDRGEVRVIERATGRVLQTIITGGRPRRIVFDVLGAYAVIPNEQGYVSFVR